MKEVKITTCCILYVINEMTQDHVSAFMPYLLFQFDSKGIIMVERLVRILCE